MSSCPACSSPPRAWESVPGAEWKYVGCSRSPCSMYAVRGKTQMEAEERWEALVKRHAPPIRRAES